MTQITKPASSNPPLPLRIITHNIRYDPSPSNLLPQERPWPFRLPLLISQFHFLTHLPFCPPHSLICMQEVLTNQIDDLSCALGDDWAWVGVGRDDGKHEGERCVILYRRRFWRKVWFETVWLNETGEVGRKGWDAGSVRVITCLVLDALTGSESSSENNTSSPEVRAGRGRNSKRILLLNIHLDNAGPESRRQSAHILLDVLSSLKAKYSPDFYAVAGDLNSEVHGEPWEILRQAGSGLEDALLCFPVNPGERNERVYGDFNTYTGLDGDGDEDERPQRIDFVFVCGKEQGHYYEESMNGFATIPNGWETPKKGKMSDHRAACVDVVV